MGPSISQGFHRMIGHQILKLTHPIPDRNQTRLRQLHPPPFVLSPVINSAELAPRHPTLAPRRDSSSYPTGPIRFILPQIPAGLQSQSSARDLRVEMPPPTVFVG